MRSHSFTSFALVVAATITSLPSAVAPPDATTSPPTRTTARAPADCPAMVDLAASLRRAGLTAQAAKNAAVTIRQDCRLSQAPAGASAPYPSA